MVDRAEYVDELGKLNVHASTMPFMLGNDLRSVLPGINHDLRHYLEKHLMHKPGAVNDFDEIDEQEQALFEEKERLNDVTKLVNHLTVVETESEAVKLCS